MTDMNQTIPIVINLVVSLILATGGTLFSEWIAKLLIPRTQTLINSYWVVWLPDCPKIGFVGQFTTWLIQKHEGVAHRDCKMSDKSSD